MRQGQIYQAIKEENETYGYPISALCKLGNVSRSAYYKWLHRKIPANEIKNLRISDAIEKIHTDSPDKGYRRIRDDLERYYGIKVNDKRVFAERKILNPQLNMLTMDAHVNPQIHNT